MHRNHERQSVVQLRQNPAEMRVPGVAMHQIGIDARSVEIRAALDRAEHGAERLWAVKLRGVEAEATHLQIAFIAVLLTETAHLHLDQFRELAREIFHVNPCAAVNMRGVFVSKEERLDALFLAQRPRLASLVSYGKPNERVEILGRARDADVHARV